MTVSDDDLVDRIGRIAGLRHQCCQITRALAAHHGAEAGIEHHQFLAGIDNGDGKGVLEPFRRKALLFHIGFDRGRVLVVAEYRMRAVALDEAIHNIGDFEFAKFEAIDLRPEHAEHVTGHDFPCYVRPRVAVDPELAASVTRCERFGKH
jgi:hypothetical protein